MHEGADRDVVVAGMVTSIRQSFTRDGKAFVVAELEDTSGTVEVTVSPRVHEVTKGLWAEGALIIVKGQLRTRDGRAQVTCQQAQRYVPSNGTGAGRARSRELILEVNETSDPEGDEALLSKVISLLRQHPGADRVTLVINTRNGTRAEFDIPSLRVSVNENLGTQLDTVLAGSSYHVN